MYKNKSVTFFENYQSLFRTPIEPGEIEVIRKAANRDQVLGNDRFKEEIEAMLKRKVTSYEHGGDRKSETFKQCKQ